MHRLLFAVLAFAVVLAAGNLHACSCAVATPKHSFQSADAVFLGEVLDYDGAVARMRVLEWFKGPQDSTIEIVSGEDTAACGYGGALLPGSRHLIFTTRHELFSYFEVTLCSGTKREQDAAGDLALLRSRGWWWRSPFSGLRPALTRWQEARERSAAAREAAPTAATTPGAPSGSCFMYQSLDGSDFWVDDRVECAIPKSPASTFKIPHALIALDTGVVTDPLQTVPWDGSDQTFETWERDHSLDSAIKWSVLPFFRRTASLIGRERMVERLRKLGYANDTFEGELTSFWVNGDLVISPEEQLRFLRRMMRYELPVRREHVDAVKAAFLMPPGKLTNASGIHDFALGPPGAFVVRAKTGNTRMGEERVSWVIGHFEAGKREFVFVSRVRDQKAIPGTAAAEHMLQRLQQRLTDAGRK